MPTGQYLRVRVVACSRVLAVVLMSAAVLFPSVIAVMDEVPARLVVALTAVDVLLAMVSARMCPDPVCSVMLSDLLARGVGPVVVFIYRDRLPATMWSGRYGRVIRCARRLSPTQHQTACRLAPDFPGTVAELLITVRSRTG